MSSEWNVGYPHTHGYYLATWLRGPSRVPTVSELWFNPAGGFRPKWFASRGYVDDVGRGDSREVDNVIAWKPMPPPCSTEIAKQLSE